MCLFPPCIKSYWVRNTDFDEYRGSAAPWLSKPPRYRTSVPSSLDSVDFEQSPDTLNYYTVDVGSSDYGFLG